jgi:hypothetical protein
MKKTTIIIVCVAVVAIALIASFYFGNKKGKDEGIKATEGKLNPLINLAFPKPSEKITNLTGVIKAIYGATIDFEIADPEDYLPHTDGSSTKKEIRVISLSKTTELFSITLDKQGNPKTIPVKLSDLKTGDTITAYSNENIRNSKKFDAVRIELLKF